MVTDVYLDNAATTKPKFFAKDYLELWHNSNTPYARYESVGLEQAKQDIKDCLGVKSGVVLFTRCATESIEWLCNQFVTDECWCSPYEHDSVYKACSGLVLNEANRARYYMQDYSLYCHQLVNQLTGVVFDIKAEHDEWCTKCNQFFGVDLTAAIGHIPLPKHMDEYCDALWWSGHKFHTDKGIGGLWISDRLFEFLGGKKDPRNNYGLIHGTINVSATLVMADAMKRAVAHDYRNDWEYMAAHLAKMLYENDIHFNFVSEGLYDQTSAISLLHLPGINADALQQYLSTKHIYVGIAGSACSESHDYRVPKAFGLTDDEASQCIRVSFDEDTTQEDVEALTEGIKAFKKVFG